LELLLIWLISLKLWFNFSHANWRLELGRLGYLFISPQVHRIHHSVEQRHINKNFASLFPVIDMIFGTYYHPRKDEWPSTGLIDEDMPTRTKDFLLLPFFGWIDIFRRKRKSELDQQKDAA
jgi:sterol desaturase/sphingolipid hydroxylase (fatty acid hydroxylase superfamily)